MVTSKFLLHHKLDNTTITTYSSSNNNNNNTGSTSCVAILCLQGVNLIDQWVQSRLIYTDHNQSSDSLMKPGDSWVR